MVLARLGPGLPNRSSLARPCSPASACHGWPRLSLAGSGPARSGPICRHVSPKPLESENKRVCERISPWKTWCPSKNTSFVWGGSIVCQNLGCNSSCVGRERVNLGGKMTILPPGFSTGGHFAYPTPRNPPPLALRFQDAATKIRMAPSEVRVPPSRAMEQCRHPGASPTGGSGVS